MEILRTPEARFAELADYPFAPHYAQAPGPGGTSLRLHYVDEGPRDGTPVLLLHGEPSWSYLYRKIIADLAARGRRVLAPDLIGFGRSDKPAERGDYTYERHVAWMSHRLTGLDLTNLVLFCQDWGGLIGLRLVAAMPERFAAVVAANTGLPEGEPVSEAFDAWLRFSQSGPVLPIGGIIAAGCARALSDAERAAYDAPFPDERFKAGARQFPTLVPITPGHASVAENRQAWTVLERFDRPFVTAFSDGDPVTAGRDLEFQARVPGARGREHLTLRGGHFLQEDSPAEVAALLDSLATETAQEPA